MSYNAIISKILDNIVLEVKKEEYSAAGQLCS